MSNSLHRNHLAQKCYEAKTTHTNNKNKFIGCLATISMSLLTGVWVQRVLGERERVNVCAFDATECIFMSVRQQHRGHHGCYAIFFPAILLLLSSSFHQNISGTFSTSLFIKRHIRGWHSSRTHTVQLSVSFWFVKYEF